MTCLSPLYACSKARRALLKLLLQALDCLSVLDASLRADVESISQYVTNSLLVRHAWLWTASCCLLQLTCWQECWATRAAQGAAAAEYLTIECRRAGAKRCPGGLPDRTLRAILARYAGAGRAVRGANSSACAAGGGLQPQTGAVR